MGCDIHCYVEKLVDHEWVSQNQESPQEIWDDAGENCTEGEMIPESVHISRNYGLFGLLNKGVRWECEQSFPYTHSLPDDVSVPVKKASDGWGDDGHSHGCLTLQQLNEKLLELTIHPIPKKADHEYLMSGLQGFINELFKPDDKPQESRVVFWFDN